MTLKSAWGASNDSDTGAFCSTPAAASGQGGASGPGGPYCPQSRVPVRNPGRDDVNTNQSGPDLRPPIGR